MVLSGAEDRMLEEEAKRRLLEKIKKAEAAGYNLMIMAGGKSYGIPPQQLALLLMRNPNHPIVRQLIDAEKRQLMREMGYR